MGNGLQVQGSGLSYGCARNKGDAHKIIIE